MNDRFNEVYLNIINESLGKALKNFATFKWTDKSKNKELQKTIENVLNKYGFDVFKVADKESRTIPLSLFKSKS